jgi:hypothetical protein
MAKDDYLGTSEYRKTRQAEAKSRARELLGMVRAGATLADAGKAHKISRQRVYMLLTTYFPAEYARAKK